MELSTRPAQVNAEPGSELRLMTGSESVKSGNTTTITVGEGSYIRLAAG